jgi:membrane protein
MPVKALIARIMRTKPVRVALHYGHVRGPILASGLAYSAIFAVFAALWVGFSIAGAIIANDVALRTALIATLSDSVPGLIDTGDGEGAIDPDDLLDTGTFTWTGAIALVWLLATALGWLAAARNAVRVLFHLPPPPENILVQRLKDLLIAVGFGSLLILSALLSVVGTRATEFLLDLFALNGTLAATVLSRVVSLTIMFVLDVVVLGAFFRVLVGLSIPLRLLRSGVIIGAVALGTLKVLGSTLLGGGNSNPLLASFAVIIGLLIFFNLVCQVILVSAAWVATTVDDAGVVLDAKVEQERLEEARALVEEHDAEVDAATPHGFWARRRARKAAAQAERDELVEATRAERSQL